MIRNTAVIALALALSACAQSPCPERQARDNAGQCVAVDRTQLPEGFVLDAPAPPPPGFVIDEPAKDQYVTAEAQAAWAADNARRQQEWQAEWDNRRAEARADARIDRIVEAHEDTRRAIEAADSGR